MEAPKMRAVRNVRSQKIDQVTSGKKLIVTIGIDAYEQMPRLSNAVNDARGISELFIGTLGFTAPVAPLFDADATERNINRLIQNELPKVIAPNDAVVIFFAGHGVTRTSWVGERKIETGFLVPVNAGHDQWSDYINMDHFLDNLSRLPARHVLVILDACHSGFALGQALLRYRDSSQYEHSLLRRDSRRIITSAMGDQRALDGGPVPSHSLFTGSLIHGIQTMEADTDNNGLVTVSELSLYLQSQVSQYSGSQQTPDFGCFKLDNRGELVLRMTEKGATTLVAALAHPFQERSANLAPLVSQRERLPFEPLTVLIPAGEFQMGSDDPDAPTTEQPQHTLFLPNYAIGVYPVTVAQYAAFISAERSHPTPPGWFNRKPPPDRDDHPITHVSWHDAIAYCRWLSVQTEQSYTLPSEAELEKAATHAPDNPQAARRYPWGDEWHDGRCNSDNSATTPVDAFVEAGGGSAYGVQDLLGNVQEWTRSQWGNSPLRATFGYPYDPTDGREVHDPDQLSAQARLVVRGGHYKRRAVQLRNSARGQAAPNSKVDWRGFRVVNLTDGA